MLCIEKFVRDIKSGSPKWASIICCIVTANLNFISCVTAMNGWLIESMVTQVNARFISKASMISIEALHVHTMINCCGFTTAASITNTGVAVYSI